MSELKSKFLEVYSVLKSELLTDPAFEFTDDSRQWVERMLDYNVPGGKLNRGLSVIDSYKLLKDRKELSDDEIFLASALGWCIEWLQAYFLVLDDIMDGSHTRRGQPCWFRLPKVGLIAVNDGLILRNQIFRILKKHFRGKPYYVELLDLFNEVEFQTASGQMIDLITTIQGEKDLSKYSLSIHRRIVQYKTAYYSFYLPVACALLMAGEDLDNHTDLKNVLVEMGIYFQVQTSLELFFAIWFVMGNVWVFDSRFGSFHRAPNLHELCISLLAWNALSYSFPFLLFLLLCCCVPLVSSLLGYNMNVGSTDRGASDDQISMLPSWRYKEINTNLELDHDSDCNASRAIEDPECCICLAKYKDKEEVRQLPCSHIFHLKCVDQWLRIISCCPLCKQELER